MPLHKQEQGGVFCLTRDLFPPRTPSALFQALSRHCRLTGNQAWVSGISLSCREDDSQPQAREWMRLYFTTCRVGRAPPRTLLDYFWGMVVERLGWVFLYSLELTKPIGAANGQGSCGQQCTSLVCPTRLRKALWCECAFSGACGDGGPRRITWAAFPSGGSPWVSPRVMLSLTWVLGVI